MAPSAGNMELRVHKAQVETLFRVLKPSLWIGFFAPIVLGQLLYWFYDLEWRRMAVWSLLHGVMLVVRFSIYLIYWRSTPERRQATSFCAIFATACLFNGLCWGLGSVFVLAPEGMEAEMIVLLQITAYSALSITILGNYLPAYLATIVPICIPHMMESAIHRDAFHLSVFALSLGLLLTMIALASATNRNLRQALRLDIEKLDLIEALQKQNEIIERTSQAKSRFLASASHDLRQPVHALGMFVGALQEQPLNPQSSQLLDQVSGAVNAMDSLFASLLDISKLDAGVVRANSEVFRVGPILERICGDFAIDAEKKGIAISNCRTGLIVRSDPVLLESVLRNLVSNAIRYTDRGRVLVGCRRGAQIRIDVIDTGRGIPPDEIDKIFDEFYQVGNPERDRAKGLGLGLAIVKRVVALMGCELLIDSRLHRGTRVSVLVPVAASAPEPEARSLRECGEIARELTIFVIDDEAAIRSGAKCLLESWGHRVFVADSGPSMLALAGELPLRPDLLICDFRLRDGENGIAVLNRLRDEYNENIPGMLITGDTAPERLAAAVRSDYMILHKPISSAKLRAAIRTAVAPVSALQDEAEMLA